MNVSFFQVPKLFVENSTYLGELIELAKMEVNVDLKSLQKFDLLLSEIYQMYNYVGVELQPGSVYYYFLESQTYYNAQMRRFNYTIDVIRTLSEKKELSHNLHLSKYSNILEMSPEQETYFWKNQNVKVGATLIDKYHNAHYPYSELKGVQDVWKDMKWLYIWLQPRVTQTETGQIFQYSFTKRITETIINVLAASLPMNQKLYQGTYMYGLYPLEQAYYATDTQRYFRCVQRWEYIAGTANRSYYKIIIPLVDFNATNTTYYLHTIPTVHVDGVPNSLYCLVLPMSKVELLRFYVENGVTKSKTMIWSADELLPYLFDVEAQNNWNAFIVDAKVSLIPPTELSAGRTRYSVTQYSIQNEANIYTPAIIIESAVEGSSMNVIENLSHNVVRKAGSDILSSDIFMPFLKSKPNSLFKLNTSFTLPEVNKINVLQKKYCVSTVEKRQELDVVFLNATNAKTLYYFEDLFPGRTNVILGYGPNTGNQETILYYLLHSPSTIFFDRDNALPIFTTNYQAYIANNKNFVQQAQLQRDSELLQSLVSSGATAGGAAAVASSLKGYSPYAAVAVTGGKIANAFISKDVQEKQFNWSVDNIKSAPGNYKAATATLSFMLTLDLYNIWIEEYKVNEFDVMLYDELIDHVGFDYYNFPYTLEDILDSIVEGASDKKFLQARLTGLTNENIINMPLINLLSKVLIEGVNIFI
jgi:hypothetical protein